MTEFWLAVKAFAANAARNPKTTALGLAALGGCVKSAIADYSVTSEAWWWTSLFASAGLLTAKDSTTSGTASGNPRVLPSSDIDTAPPKVEISHENPS